MSGLQEILSGLTLSNGGYKTQITEGWRQGRTLYGGLTAGLALAATQQAFPDLPALRSSQINFIGPVTDDPVITPIILRQGKNVVSVRTDMHCGDALVATCVFIFGRARDSQVQATWPAPMAPLPKDCEAFTPPKFEKFVPKFFLRFETKLIAGGRPATSADDAYIRCWSRHKDTASRIGAPSFLTLGDVLPPAAIPTFKKFGPISSVNWQMNILSDITTTDGWWHVETKQTAARDGYSSQIMRFWNSDGVLVAEGTQLVAIFV